MPDGTNISSEQGEERPPPVLPSKNAGLDKIFAEEAEKRAHFAELFWKDVQREAAGEPTELTKPGVSTIESRAVALAAKEGLLLDRKSMETWVIDLNRGRALTSDFRQQRALELLNQLRVSQGKPPIVPVPPQAPKPATEVKSRSINPLNWLKKKS